MSGPTVTFIPAPGSPCRVIPEPAQLTFLEPIGSHPARKAHRLIQRGDGAAELATAGYGKAKHFRHCSAVVADVDDLFAALETHAPHNRFAIRGQVRPDAGPVINRGLKYDGADIVDVPSPVVAVDLDCEVAPDGIDTGDILAVGDYLRSRLPGELSGASCVVQLSGSYGLWQFNPGPVLLKARLWFVNDAPLDGQGLQRWFAAMNATGRYAVMDATVATANQAIYTAAPLFSGMTDPVPTRLALLLSGEGVDVASIRPPLAPSPVTYAAGAVGERCPARLSLLVQSIRRAADQGLPRHPAINNAAFTAGRMVKGGAFTRDEAVAALVPAALETGSDGAERTVLDGLAAGMKADPILIGAALMDEAGKELPPVTLNQQSDFAADLRLLGKCHPAQARTTARKILTRYAPQSPRKRSFTGLSDEVIAALPAGCNPGLPRSLRSFAEWLERQARIAAVRNSSIEVAQLRNAGIEHRTVADLDGLAVAIAADSRPLYLVRAAHGTGKTELVLKPLAQLPGCSVAVTNRVSLVADLCHRLDLANYQTLKPRDMEAVDALGLCLPSVTNPKFGEVLNRATAVLVDEVGSCWRELHTIGGTLKKTGPDAVRRLIAMLNQARIAVGVDADLSTQDVLSIAGLVQRPVVVVEMTPVEHSGRVIFADADEVKAEILTAVAQGEKCRIACDSSRTAIELAALIRAQNPDKKVVCIQSRGGDSTAGDDEVLALLRDVNAGIASIDVLIHSPTVESGVSITVKHFDRTFGLFSGRSVAPAAFIQMLKRDRTVELFELGFAGHCRQWLETRPLALLANMEHTHRATVEIVGDSGAVSGLVKIEPATDWDRRVVEYAAARNADVNDAGQHLLLLLEARGYAVNDAGLATVVDKEAKLEARRLADLAYSNAVLNAMPIDSERRDELDNQYQLNPMESAEVERYDAAIANSIEPAELTADDLRLYEHGALTKWNRRFDLLQAPPLAAVANDVADADFIPQLALRRFDLAVGEAYRTFFEVVGFDPATGTGELTADAALEAWRNLRASPCRAVLEHSGLCRFDREPRYPVRWIGDALDKFGLALVAQGADRADRRYTIGQDMETTKDGITVKAAGWAAMVRVWQTRQERSKDIRPASASFDPAVLYANWKARAGATA